MPDLGFNRLIRGFACAGALTLSTAAMADISFIISAGGIGVDGNTDTTSFDSSVKQVSGHMFAGVGQGSGGGSVILGPLPCLSVQLCGLQAATIGSNAAGTVDMNSGHLGVGGRAWASPPVSKDHGRVSLNVDDFLSGTGSLTFNVRINVGLDATNIDADTFSTYAFRLSVKTPDFIQPFFEFEAWDDPHYETTDLSMPSRGSFSTISRFWNGPGDVTTTISPHIPGVFQTSVVVPFDLSGSMHLLIHNSAVAEAHNDPRTPGGSFASVSSLNSGYLGIVGNYTSASGYTYTGFSGPTIPDPGVPAIPEPSTTALMLLGGGLMAFVVAHRRRQRRA